MSNTVKIQVTPAGQYVLTLPKSLAEAMNVEQGQKATWSVKGAGKLELSL